MVVEVGGDNWEKNTRVSYIDEGSNPKVHTCVQGGKVQKPTSTCLPANLRKTTHDNLKSSLPVFFLPKIP